MGSSNRNFIYKCFLFMSALLKIYSSACQFPEFLRQNVLWYSLSRQGTGLKVYFEGNKYDATRTDEERVSYESICLEEMKPGRFLVQINEENRIPAISRYSCIQFIKVSDFVVQIKESQGYYRGRSAHLCEDSTLVLDNWPLLASPIEDAPRVKCPFSGGYNIMKIIFAGDRLCTEELIPPRLESECENGDGIEFDFRSRRCVKEIFDEEYPKIRFKCIASWKHNQYTFSILERSGSVFCLRVEEPLDGLKSVKLFRDPVCDPSDGNSQQQITETFNYITFELESKNFPSVCVNEYEDCRDEVICQYRPENCHLTCEKCSPDVELCPFPESLRGSWYLGNPGSLDIMDVSTYDLSIPGEGKFTCIAQNDSSVNRFFLLHVFENGCFPRFACMEANHPSKTALQYRISEREKWPLFPLEKAKEKTCRKFGKHTPLKTVLDGDEFSSVNCELPLDFDMMSGPLYIRSVNISINQSCDSCLSYTSGLRDDKFEVININCTDERNLEASSYVCAVSYNLTGGARAVVTGTIPPGGGKPVEFYCWIFTGKGDSRRIFKFNSADCNENKLKAIMQGEATAKKTYRLVDSARDLCPLIAVRYPASTFAPTRPPKLSNPTKTQSTKYGIVTLGPPSSRGLDSLNKSSKCCNINIFCIISFFIFQHFMRRVV